MRELPSGTVTFLFTDIEGSTKLLHDLGHAYAEALAEHRRVLREAFVRHGGVEVDTQGDAFFVAFARAKDALAAAHAAQQALDRGPIKVRMGLHTGEPIVTDEGYVGIDVHLGARIAAVGHGGQVLLSHATRRHVDDGVVELGEHRLKDFTEPVPIFQLGAAPFPPLRTISNTNLPRPASSFVGRAAEIDQLARLVRNGTRILTLVGPGGSGKTRLAIEVAALLVPEFKAGVYWVGLAPLRDASLVDETIAQILGAKDDLVSHLRGRELLLLLDNFEQVVEAASGLAALVEQCPNLRVLVTSRERLRIAGETDYAVAPLADRDSVELFCARANVSPDRSVEALCRALENLPLALELAAARTTVLSPEQILDRLSQRLDLFKGGRDADPRQQTLRATIAWSHELLSDDEQQLFARLAVFRGGCTLEAAEQVAYADIDTLQSLVDKSLLRHTRGRFWMLETIREYATERREESSPGDELQRRLADFILTLAVEAEPHLRGRDQERWLTILQSERDNIRAALEWAIAADPTLATQLVASLGRFWWVRGAAEGLGWAERALESPDLPPEMRAAALDTAGGSAWFVGDSERAHRFFEEALSLYRQLGDRAGEAKMLTRLGPPLVLAQRRDEAERVVGEAIAINREAGDDIELSLSLSILGSIILERGEFDRAEELIEESLAVGRRAGDLWQVAWTLQALAQSTLERGDAERAWSLGQRALRQSHEVGDELGVLICLTILALAAARRGESRRAGTLWGTVERLDHELGETMWRREFVDVQEKLGGRDADFETGVDAGRRLSIDEAVAYALDAAP